MAVVYEYQFGRRLRRARQTIGTRSRSKTCVSCGRKTHWLSMEKTCWDCTINIVSLKKPLHLENEGRDTQQDYHAYLYGKAGAI